MTINQQLWLPIPKKHIGAALANLEGVVSNSPLEHVVPNILNLAFEGVDGEALLMGAAAQHHGLFLCVQDLTCVGASFLHSASLAARIPGIAAIEGNGRQYCPLGNSEWEGLYPEMFQITDGRVGTGSLVGSGLGFPNHPGQE